jgi:hypothetical protein
VGDDRCVSGWLWVIEERIADRCREAEAGRPAASFASRQSACAVGEINASPWNRDAKH